MSNSWGEIGKLGFGMMRLPRVKDGDAIDIEQTKQMVDEFLGAGFNYFDTAWAYAGSEEAVRKALVERYPRERFKLATKMAAWIKCKSREDALAQFDASLERSGAGYFDFYLMHNLGGGRERYFEDWHLWDWAREQKERGTIRHLGFSFHSTPDELERIIEAHPEAEFVQLQINWADWESGTIQSRGCYETARKHGLPIIVMEPVKGGLLASLPGAVDAIFKGRAPDVSTASWAVRYAADLEGVLTVLSGMSSIEQMRDNISHMRGFSSLSDEERAMIARAADELAKIETIPCTACKYCVKVCPVHVGIPDLFSAMNTLTLYGDEKAAKHSVFVTNEMYGTKKASECVKCGACEQACPQHIAIRSELEKIAAALE